MDPLTVLRDFVIDKRIDDIIESADGTRILFADRKSFPKDAVTAYKSQRGRGDFYPLSSLVFFLKNAKKGGDLIKAANQAGVKPVTFIDRRDLEAYLSGEKDMSDYIQLPSDELQPAAKKARPEATEGEQALADLLGRERSLRDRNSQLLVPGKTFAAALTILGALARAPAYKKEVIPILPSRRFERPTGEGLAAMGIDEYKGQQIDAYGARKSSSDPASAELPPPPPPPPPQQARKQQPSATQPSSSHRSRHLSSREKQEKQDTHTRSDPAIGGVPIIIVPAVATATVNMLNAKEFLEQGRYRLPQQVAEEGGAKVSVQKFGRTIGRSEPVRYVVTDKAPATKSHDWKRVVAVFVSGAAWQFKGWPFPGAAEGNLADAMSRMLGVYVGLKGEIVPENVKKWNVLKVEVPKDNRHRDRPIVQDIYTALDNFLAAHHSRLKY